MNYYISTWKKIKPKKFSYNILKKRINTINVLNNNKFIETLNEDDIEFEQNNLIPIRAIKLYNKEKQTKMNKLLIKNNQKKLNYKRPFSSKIKYKTNDSNFFLKKYQNFLNEENNNKNKIINNENKNTLNNNSLTFNNKNKKNNQTLKINNLISKNSTLNDDETTFFHTSSHQTTKPNFFSHFNETISENISLNTNNLKKNKNKMLFFSLDSNNSSTERSIHKLNTISNLNRSKNTNSILLTSTNLSYSNKKNNEKFLEPKDKTMKKYYLDYLNEYKKEKKLNQLKQEINNFDNTVNTNNVDEKLEKKKQKIVYNEDKFIRTGYNNLKKGKKIILHTNSKIKQYINQPMSNRPNFHKKKFKLFDQIIIDSEINDLNKNYEKNNENKKKKPKKNFAESWFEKIENDIKNEILRYQHNLGEFMYDDKYQGVHQSIAEDVNFGERQFKEAVFESKREKDINLDNTIKEKALIKKKTFLDQAFKEMNLLKKNSRKIHIKYSNKY